MPPNPSTIWATLAVPNPAAGGIPFIFTDNATPTIDVQNLWWDQVNHRFSIATTGDQTGTDSVNLYNQVDSFQFVQNQVLSAPGSLSAGSVVNGLSISAARGSYLVPAAVLPGDALGISMSWAWQSGIAAYAPMAGEYYYASGAAANNLGGEIHWCTKANAGLLTDRLKLDNVGTLQPTSVTIVANTSFVASARLGAANQGFGALSLAYVLAGVTGAVVQNTPAGQVQIAAGSKSVVVTNSLVTANSVVIAQLQTVDATLLKVLTVVPAAGSFTINCDVNATGTVKICYLVIGTDS